MIKIHFRIAFYNRIYYLCAIILKPEIYENDKIYF